MHRVDLAVGWVAFKLYGASAAPATSLCARLCSSRSPYAPTSVLCRGARCCPAHELVSCSASPCSRLGGPNTHLSLKYEVSQIHSLPYLVTSEAGGKALTTHAT